MARPRYRDVFAWICTLPSSVLLIVCLFLPQAKTCHGHARTPIENGTAWMLVTLAVLGLVPLVWRWRRAHEPITIAVVALALVIAIVSVIGIAIAAVLAWLRAWRSNEELAALCCFAMAVVFVLIFPFAFLFDTWLVGAGLAWLAGWIMIPGFYAWWWAACTRTALREASSFDDARIC